MKKGYIKRDGLIVTQTGEICCDNENCQYNNDIGLCEGENVECVYSRQKYDALLHYAFADDKVVEIYKPM